MEERNDVFAENEVQVAENGKKPTHVPALVVGILSIVFAILFALVGDILGIVGIVLSVVKRNEYNTKAALICSIIGLVLAIANNILGALMAIQAMSQFGM